METGERIFCRGTKIPRQINRAQRRQKRRITSWWAQKSLRNGCRTLKSRLPLVARPNQYATFQMWSDQPQSNWNVLCKEHNIPISWFIPGCPSHTFLKCHIKITTDRSDCSQQYYTMQTRLSHAKPNLDKGSHVVKNVFVG